MYIRKDANGQPHITEIKTLPSMARKEQFLTEISALTRLPGLSKKINYDLRKQVLAHDRLEDLAEDFDVDFDLFPDAAPSPKKE